MVCIYCSGPLGVVNSRAQKQKNQTWRRRNCKVCGAIFTTTEQVDYARSFVVQDASGALVPFMRDKLFVSILKSCQHRSSALQDAGGLTDTILAQVLHTADNGVVLPNRIAEAAHKVLERFDHAAAVQYAAYHPLA